MWNGKYKALTFSYDDGIEQDRRLVELFNRYGVKCTFNLNSGIMNPDSYWENNGVQIRRMRAEGMKELYAGHEIACHALTHPDLTKMTRDEMLYEVMEDKKNLEKIFGCEMVGMAYPYGAYNEEVFDVLKECGIRYCRTVEQTGTYGAPQPEKELLRLFPSAHHKTENLLEVAKAFVAEEPDPKNPKLLYIWGHSYEFDVDRNWEIMEELLKVLSGHEDIFYGTNREVLLES